MKSATCILVSAIALALAGAAPATAALQGAAPAVALGVAIEPDPEGIKVARVMPGATAASIGVEAGDVIVEVGGRAASGPQVVAEYVQGLQVGDAVSVLVKREGRTVELTGRAMPRPEGMQVGQQAQD